MALMSRRVLLLVKNLVYFGACSVFRGKAGYATDVDWMESMLADLLFLRRFYADTDPWRNLEAIHASVLEDFAPARRLGLRLFSGQLLAR